MEEVLDGEMQRYTVSDGAYIREHFFGKYPELLELVRTTATSRSASSPAAATTP